MTHQASHKYRTNIKYTAWWAQHVERIKHCFTKYLACKITPANFLQSWKRLLIDYNKYEPKYKQNKGRATDTDYEHINTIRRCRN